MMFRVAAASVMSNGKQYLVTLNIGKELFASVAAVRWLSTMYCNCQNRKNRTFFGWLRNKRVEIYRSYLTATSCRNARETQDKIN